MTFPNEFKEAISHLSSKEKDKLILRLLKKDLKLANRLMFELVSDESVEERREILLHRIKEKAKRTHDTFYSIGWLNMDVRDLSGEINEHVAITKDKFGEIQLNLIMINSVLEANNETISHLRYVVKTRKFCTAVISRAFKILILISKTHEDLWLEFEDELKRFGMLIANNKHLKQTARKNGLDVNWLINFDIPEDIMDIHKQLRSDGFLK